MSTIDGKTMDLTIDSQFVINLPNPSNDIGIVKKRMKTKQLFNSAPSLKFSKYPTSDSLDAIVSIPTFVRLSQVS